MRETKRAYTWGEVWRAVALSMLDMPKPANAAGMALRILAMLMLARVLRSVVTWYDGEPPSDLFSIVIAIGAAYAVWHMWDYARREQV